MKCKLALMMTFARGVLPPSIWKTIQMMTKHRRELLWERRRVNAVAKSSRKRIPEPLMKSIIMVRVIMTGIFKDKYYAPIAC